MKAIGILGTGMVGTTIGTKLVSLGYEVKMGSRTPDNEKAREWEKANGPKASQGTFEDAVMHGEVIFNCTKGMAALEAIKMGGLKNYSSKIIIDISNPLDFSQGSPPRLAPEMVNTNSLGEEIQKLIPDAHVVKTLNIVNCDVMVDAKKSGGVPTMFMAGNDEKAKEKVKEILAKFNWEDIIDIGDITGARALEMMLPIWLLTYMATGQVHIGFKVVGA